MANKTTKNFVFSTKEVSYELILPEKIYDELGISQELFAELLSRDLYCPTLTTEPTSTTLTYTDTDGSTNHFQVGQPCRWLDGSSYRMAICTNATESATAWYILPDTGTLATGTITEVKANGTSVAASGVANIPAASTSVYGVTKLTNSTSSTSTTTAATPSSVRSAYNLANGKAAKVTVSNQTATSKSISPNIFYVWGTMSTLSITLATPSDSTIYNEYMFQFTSGTTATNLSLPSSVTWATEPLIESGKTYQVSIVNNLAVIGGF